MAAAKFPIIIAAVVAVMAALVLLPGLDRQGEPTDQVQIEIDYTKRNLTRTAGGVLATASAEVLAIRNDGSAEYSRVAPEGTISDRQSFSLSGQEMSRLKALFGSGFMQIPITDYPQREGLANFTKYTVTVKVDGSSKTISWVNPEAYDGTIPPVIANTGSRLDAVIMAGRA